MPDIRRWNKFCCTKDADGRALFVFVVERANFAEWFGGQSKDIQEWVKMNGLANFKSDSLLMLPAQLSGDSKAIAIFFTADATDRYAFSSLPAKLAPSDYSLCSLRMAAGCPVPASAVFSWGIGCYKFDRYKDNAVHAKKADGPTFASLLLPELSAEEFATQERMLEATYLVRDLITTPTEDLGPAQLEEATRALAAQCAATVESIVGQDLLAKNYPQIHAVGRAAGVGREPRLIDLRWGDESAPKVTLVGKGVCYDTGGLSIKSTDGMLMMKKDMGGSANCLGLALLIMKAKLPVRLRVLIAAVENDISGGCYRPGDVIVARDGRTTEVMNTDAEGRLILADALVEASLESPQLIVDCATLTGARTVALGTDVGAVFANKEAEADAARLQAISMEEQDPLWQLPLWAPYMNQLDSHVADLKNINQGSAAGGSIIAALYLNEFVRAPVGSEGPAPPWLHIDFGAWIVAAKPGRPVGGEMQGMRALFRLLEQKFAT